jgi:hypothetical protein
LLAESSWRTVRQEASGPASRADRCPVSSCSLVVPLSHVLGVAPDSLFTNITTPSSSPRTPPPSHSLSLLPHGHHLHCPWSQDLDPSTAREPLYELQGPTPFDFHPLEPLSSNLGQEQGICNLPSISLLDAYLEECFWLWIPAK